MLENVSCVDLGNMLKDNSKVSESEDEGLDSLLVYVHRALSVKWSDRKWIKSNLFTQKKIKHHLSMGGHTFLNGRNFKGKNYILPSFIKESNDSSRFLQKNNSSISQET